MGPSEKHLSIQNTLVYIRKRTLDHQKTTVVHQKNIVPSEETSVHQK